MIPVPSAEDVQEIRSISHVLYGFYAKKDFKRNFLRFQFQFAGVTARNTDTIDLGSTNNARNQDKTGSRYESNNGIHVQVFLIGQVKLRFRPYHMS